MKTHFHHPSVAARRFLCVCVSTLLVTSLTFSPAASASTSAPWGGAITEGTLKVSDGHGSQVVTYVRVNLHNPHVAVEPVIANHHLGSTATLGQLASSLHAVAAINGTFFQDSSNDTPQSTLLMNGQYQHLWGPTIWGITAHGTMQVVRGQEQLAFTFQNNRSSPVISWGLNTWNGSPGEIEVMTPFYGSQTSAPHATVLVVKNGVVTAIHHGQTAIPEGGKCIVLADGDAYNERILSRVKVGDVVSMQTSMIDTATHHLIAFSDMQSAIGSGPLLVDAGKVVLNPTLERLNLPSLLQPATRRSFLGEDAAGNLILATVRNASMTELASIAYHMHLVEAMNLDGGASSGLYYHGKYLLAPGRQVADALTVSYNS
jgi:exopolysaccharide biosynthesis protein